MRANRQHGMTLIELIVTIAVVSIAVTALLGAIGVLAKRSAEALVSEQAASIANAYLDEALSKSFTDPAPPINEGARALFDNVADYNGLNDNGARDHNGTALAGLDQFQVSIAVVQGMLPAPVPASAVLRVDVTVTHPSGANALASGYRVQ